MRSTSVVWSSDTYLDEAIINKREREGGEGNSKLGRFNGLHGVGLSGGLAKHHPRDDGW